MSITVLHTPHNEANSFFAGVHNDLLVLLPTVKASFLQFLNRTLSRRDISMRILIRAQSESGTEWDRTRAFSDYPELIGIIEKRRAEVRTAKFTVRAYVLDGKTVILSTVNPLEDGSLSAGGIWIVFNDPVSSRPLVKTFETYWATAENVTARDLAETLQKKGVSLGKEVTVPTNLLRTDILTSHEYALARAKEEYEKNLSPENLIDYVDRFAPFDPDHAQRIRVLERHESACGESLEVYRLLAEAYLGAGQQQEALRNAWKALEYDRKDPTALKVLIQSSIDNPQTAAMYCLEFDPTAIDDVSLLRVASRVLAQAGGHDKRAIDVLHRLNQLSKDPGERREARNHAEKIASRNGWRLGW